VATAGIQAAYETGRGGITVRGCAFVEEEAPAGGRRGARKAAPGRPVIVITELPYQTNKAAFVADVARLVDEQKLTGAHGRGCLELFAPRVAQGGLAGEQKVIVFASYDPRPLGLSASNPGLTV